MLAETRPLVKNLKEYVPGKDKSEIQRKYGLEKVVKIASNENPLGCSPRAIEAIKKAAVDVNIYPMGNSVELCQVLSDKIGVDPKNMAFSNGSDEMIWMLATAFLNPGEKVLSSEHTFSEYKFCTQLLDGQYQNIPTKDYFFDLDGILNSIDENTKMVFLCNPNNPTGNYLTAAKIDDFLKQVPSHVLVVVDQAYVEYATASDYPQLENQWERFPNLVLLRTFSKIYGLAGLRIGYALASAECISALFKVKQPFNVNLIAQKAAIAALKDEEFVQRTIQVNEEAKLSLYQFFQKEEVQYIPTQTNFIAFCLPDRAKDFVMYCESQGLILRHLASFDLVDWVRITLSLPIDMNFFKSLYKAWQKNELS
jgi:histidinol-phosphate aminotransferase